MKRYTIIVLSLLALSSCSFLDVSPNDYHGTAYQFQEFEHVKSMLTNIYSSFSDQFTDGSREVCTDNGQNSHESSGVKKYYDGTWSITSQIGDVWADKYSAIRSCNYFLENCPDDFPKAKYTEDYAQNKQQMQYYKWEARAIRAYLHFELLIRYRNIIIADRTFTMDEVNSLVPSNYQDAAKWIADECDIVSEHLPLNYSGVPEQETWRVTKGFARALKSRVLLYASSPLTAEVNLSASHYDKKLAAQAANAAYLVISSGQYNLPSEPNLIFNSVDSKEINYLVFGIIRGGSTSFESANFPLGYEGGNGGACPSDNLASAYEYADGTKFDWDNPTHAANPYLNRDPRFYRTIYYNGCKFKDVTLENYKGGMNGLPKTGATPTTYYLHKLVVENTQMTSGSTIAYKHVWPVFRIHEMYLNYAEALFEASDGNPEFVGTLDGYEFQTLSPRQAINAIRKAAGMPEIASGIGTSAFRKILRNERRVELAFEDHRFWDIRRWMLPDLREQGQIGDDEFSFQVYGVDITSVDGTFIYKRSTVPVTTGLSDGAERVWKHCYYWHPYPRSETLKNTNIKQHDGWETEN